jgi:hypothetical protein
MPYRVEAGQSRGRGLKVLVAEALTKLGKFIVGLIGFAVAAYVLANPDLIGSLRYLVVAIALAWGGAWFYLALPRAPQIPVRSAQAPKPVPVTVTPVVTETPGLAAPPAETLDVVTPAAAPPA